MERPLLCTEDNLKTEAFPGALVLPQYWEVDISNRLVVLVLDIIFKEATRG